MCADSLSVFADVQQKCISKENILSLQSLFIS